MRAEAISRSIHFSFGWSIHDYSVSCGVMIDRVDNCACPTCLKSFDRGQKIAKVEFFDSEDSDLYHFNCLPSKFCML